VRADRPPARARVPGVASFDLDVPGGSLAADLANAGLCVYIIDIRGYGDSTRPPAMTEPAEKHPPLVRSPEAAQDIDTAIDFILKRTWVTRVSLFGWVTGGQWVRFYATLHPEKLNRLILLNSLYGVDAPHPLMGQAPRWKIRRTPAISTPRSAPIAWNRSIQLTTKPSGGPRDRRSLCPRRACQ
jgi:alpha-beta hydrolase superfamily lysophospholipase